MAVPLPVVGIGNVTVVEGNSGTGTARFAVTLSDVSATDVTVQYATAPGTATDRTTTRRRRERQRSSPGTTTATIDVPIVGDTTAEGNETYAVNLSAPTSATIGTASATGTILEDDPTTGLNVGIGNASRGRGQQLNAPSQVPVTLSDPSGSDVSVDYATRRDGNRRHRLHFCIGHPHDSGR